MDNHIQHELYFYVQKIPPNNLNQVQKDNYEEDILTDATVKSDFWSSNNKSVRIITNDDENPTDIVINAEASLLHVTPHRGENFKLN